MHSVDVTLDNAQQMIIDESFQRLVVVDFWADWCGPCKTLMPILEKLAAEFQGQFLLARINADEQQPLAGQFGVRSLPTVMLIKDGQPLDGFTGAQPEPQIRQLLEKYLPKAWEQTLAQAQALMAEQDFAGALPLLRQAYEESAQTPAIGCLLAQALIELNRVEEAEPILGAIKLADQDALYQQVLAQLELKKQAAKTPEIEALEKQLEQDPDNLELAHKLALQLNQEGYHRQALELLMGILQKDLNHAEGQSKKALMDIVASLGKGDPLAAEYQRKLFTLLY
ncbi:thioredoxin [Marinimicrobium sp. ABcell2]|uniref:thioredoxin n=1 Tax=Marinimicrobium sp. ABcell2 TaxID=3069751 RepID=UPI0027B33C35|nr:thioredoxin [Marinimicrobium sp. ABcell2]MDQ2077328.1 thioredoxin [Marinimicrobium sp. ABcell2]